MGDQFLTIINQIIEDNIDNENFSVEELAEKAGLSRSMLHRKLKKLTGKSASDHITKIRLKHAKTLLENDVATVSEIAFRVGFNDPSYFNKVFKKHFKVSPGNVRKNLAVNPDHLLTDQNLEEFSVAKPEILMSAKLKAYRLFVKAVVILFIIIITGGGAYYLFRVMRSSEKSIAVLPLHNEHVQFHYSGYWQLHFRMLHVPLANPRIGINRVKPMQYKLHPVSDLF